jgi:murein DD-endopeptidase MepM/ murein hydrolase activator NlpD
MYQLNIPNDQVRAGEVIGGVGNTGVSSPQVRSSFELWNDGYPFEPVNFINF